MITTKQTQLLELLINGMGEFDLNTVSLENDTIDGIVIDNRYFYIPEDERPHIDFSIPSADLSDFIEREGYNVGLIEDFDPYSGHKQIEINIEEVEITVELVKEYLKQDGAFTING